MPRTVLKNLSQKTFQGTRKAEELTDLTRSVFRGVWLDFHAWEQEYCQDIITSLRGDPRVTSSESRQHTLSPLEETDLSHPPKNANEAEIESSYEVYDCESSVKTYFVYASSISTLDVSDFAPVLPHESTTPLYNNILHGDDSNDMPFIPFADDSTFDACAHAAEYSRLSWENHIDDPDKKTMTLETARQLHFEHGCDLTDVEQTGILPYPLRSVPNRWGLIWTDAQNNFLQWPGSSQSKFSPLPDAASPPHPDDLRTRLQDLMTLFCPNLDCVQPVCFSHESSQCTARNNDEDFIQLLEVRNDTVPASSCGTRCYASVPESHILEKANEWSQAEILNIRTLLSLDPSATPCDLSVICRKPCYEVHTYISSLLTELPRKKPGPPQNRPLIPHTKHTFADKSPKDFTPVNPCNHLGPCNATTQCGCYKARVHCERNCRCGSHCVRRWKGCRCGRPTGSKTNFCTLDSRCLCVRAGRACDPELCGSCGVRDLTQDRCCNAHLQRGRYKDVEVLPTAEWGQGVFLREDAQKGDLIYEYAGELIFESTVASRDQLAHHRGRNYVYALNTLLNVDGTFAGNATRFINHQPGDRANCVVRISLVNGNHRIGVYANENVTAGSELYLDYGPEFFADLNPVDSTTRNQMVQA